LAVAEISEGHGLTSLLPTNFGFDGPLLGSLALHGSAAVPGLYGEAEPPPLGKNGRFTRETASFLAQYVRSLFQTDWGISLVQDPITGAGFLAFSGKNHETVLEQSFTGTPEEAGRAACHALLVHLHGVMAN
jgi:hypothetical protein